MKVVFIGSKGMGVLALDELVRQKADIAAVIARHDDPSPNQWYPSVADRAKQLNLPLLKPADINDPAFVEQVRRLQPDLLFTAFYPKIYKRPLLEIPRLGSLNMHFAPLPRYRGSYPGAWAIIRGETQHGVTIHFMDPGVDSGDIVAQKILDIEPTDTGLSLYTKCEHTGLALLQQAWPVIATGNIPRKKQDPTATVYHDRNFPYGGVLNFQWTAQEVYNFVRAMTFPPFANPYTFHHQRKLTVMKCEMYGSTSAREPGRILEANGCIAVQTARGAVKFSQCLDNRSKPRPVSEIVDEYKIQPGQFLGR